MQVNRLEAAVAPGTGVMAQFCWFFFVGSFRIYSVGCRLKWLFSMPVVPPRVRAKGSPALCRLAAAADFTRLVIGRGRLARFRP